MHYLYDRAVYMHYLYDRSVYMWIEYIAIDAWTFFKILPCDESEYLTSLTLKHKVFISIPVHMRMPMRMPMHMSACMSVQMSVHK